MLIGIKVSDQYGSELFRKFRSYDVIDEYNRDKLFQLPSAQYQINDQGDWTECTIEGRTHKMVRKISYS